MKAVVMMAAALMIGCGFIGGWETVTEEDVEADEWFYHLAEFDAHEFRYSASKDVDFFAYKSIACEDDSTSPSSVELGRKSNFRLDMDEYRSWPVGLNQLVICIVLKSNEPFSVEVEKRPI